ncbi:MAG TPA: glycosyltransferase, partial [Acidimicrobiales bacterium]|nr:glycosyltransferase [Acidimicrobiales bacterium]
MRVLAACSLGGAGHLRPLEPLLDAARRAGHEVLVIGPPALAPLVAPSGHRFEAGGEPPEAEVARIREQLPVVGAAQASVLGNRDLFGRLATEAMLPAMRSGVARFAPHLVLRDPCEYASAVVALELGVPVAQVAVSLAQAEAGSIAAARPALEAHRPGLTAALELQPYLTRFPSLLDPSPFAVTRRFRSRDTAPRAPLPAWWGERRGPLVYMSFGTVLGHMALAGDVYRTALDAVARLDARVLLTVGHALDPAVLGPVPSHVHVERWVDQDRVLPHAELVVCHGGSGTTFGALEAGVPVVVVPSFSDQFENGRRVAAAGAGTTVLPGGGAAAEGTGPGGAVARRRPISP